MSRILTTENSEEEKDKCRNRTLKVVDPMIFNLSTLPNTCSIPAYLILYTKWKDDIKRIKLIDSLVILSAIPTGTALKEFIL